MKKDTYFQMRCSKDELEQIKQAAKLLGFASASDYARNFILPASSAFLSGDEERASRILNSTGKLMLSKVSISKET